MGNFETDVLIVGGGPAGLMAATYLSQWHRVTLVERGKLGETTKCWVTTQRRLQRHGLGSCVLETPSRMTAGTFLGAGLAARGDYAVVDDKQFLRTLLDRCVAQGVQMEENCRLLNLSWHGNRLSIETTRQNFLARLVVDASGGMSAIANTFRLHEIYGFYSVYGAMLRRIRLHTAEIVLGYVSELGHPPPILEVFPTGNDSAYCVVFVYSKSLMSPHGLVSMFRDHCQHNPFFQLTSDTEFEDEKAGAIPIGQRHRRHLPGVVPFGEAGIINPPLMGTAFNEVLEYAEPFCLQISRELQAFGDDLPQVRLAYPFRKRFQDWIQLPLVRTLLSGNVERFDSMLRIMSHFPEKTLFNFFSNELTLPQATSLALRLPWLFVKDEATSWLAPAEALQKTRSR